MHHDGGIFAHQGGQAKRTRSVDGCSARPFQPHLRDRIELVIILPGSIVRIDDDTLSARDVARSFGGMFSKSRAPVISPANASPTSASRWSAAAYFFC